MAGNVVDIAANKPHWNVLALCLDCRYTWVGTIQAATKLFNLECPRCGAQKSFASFIPMDYQEAACDTLLT